MRNNRAQRTKEEDFIEQLRASIRLISSSYPDDWNIILEYIENQAQQKSVHDNVSDNIAARWAYAYSRIKRILLTLSLQDYKE